MKRFALSCALAAALAVGGCQGRVPVPPDAAAAEPVGLTGSAEARAAMTDLYRRALAAGQDRVVVYSCTGTSEWEPLWRAFARTFPGLSVTYSHISPSQVMTRIDAETATGRRFGDVFIVPVNIAEDIAEAGYFRAFRPASVDGLDPGFASPTGRVYYPLAKVFGLAYNTRAVTEAQTPATFDEVLEPRWRGRYSFIKPATMNGTPDVAIANLLGAGEVDLGQLEALRDRGAYAGIEAGVTYVSQGRQAFQLWAYLPTVVRQRELGAPVAIAFPADFSTLVPFGAAISRNAVRTEAAELFQTWLFTPQAQRVLATEVNMYATMPGAPLPPFFPGPDALHPALTPAQLQTALAEQRPDLQSIFNKPVKR